MTKIKFGNQHDDSVSQHEIVSDGGDSEITFGDQYDRSKLSARILDLKDPADLAMIGTELHTFARQAEQTPEGKAHPQDVAVLKEAASHAAAGDGDSAKACLLKVGKWVLQTATTIGTPVAVQLLKSAVGLPG